MSEKTTRALRRQSKRNANKIVENYMKKNSNHIIRTSINVIAMQPLKTRLMVAWDIVRGKKIATRHPVKNVRKEN